MKELQFQAVNDWVMVKKWIEATGDTIAAIRARRRAGMWVNGVHCKVVGTSKSGAGGRLWVNVSAANEWVRTEGKAAK